MEEVKKIKVELTNTLPWHPYSENDHFLICNKTISESYRCEYCGFTCDLLMTLFNHVSLLHDRSFGYELKNTVNRYACGICEFQTYSQLILLKHICDANEFITHAETLRASNHLKKVKWYKCKQCSFNSNNKHYLEHHNASRHKNVRSQFHYSDHEKPHHQLKLKYNVKCYTLYESPMLESKRCSECEPCSFRIKKKLDRHLCPHKDLDNHAQNVISENENWFKCDQCTFKTDQKSVLYFHIQGEHLSENTKCFKCPQCSHTTNQKINLKSHIISKHTALEDIKWYRCDKCQYKTKNSSHLREHFQVRHMDAKDIKWFKCEHCSYEAKKKSNLKQHVMAKHTAAEDVKWFRCDQCNYKAVQKGSVQLHVLQKHTPHENIKWFKCRYCPYKAKIITSFRKHMRTVHLGMVTLS